MKVLLCTPYNINPQVVQSGIAIWAQNMMGYYKTHPSDVQVDVVAYDRTTYAEGNCGLLKRARLAYADYRSPVGETFRRLRSGQYDVVHFCTSASVSLIKDILLLHMARQRGVKAVVHFHFGRIPELSQKRNWEWKLLQKVVRLSNAAVIMDKQSFATLEACGFNQIHYLPNPLSQSIMQQVKQESASVKRVPRKLSFVGHVFPTKGVYELVEACKGLENISLHIFGKAFGDVRIKMQQIAAGGQWLVFEGEVSHQQVISELLSTDIFVLPSYTEGFPNVILESMVCGCAIVATPVGAIPEMLNIDSEEPCGLCCKPEDAEDLRCKIQYLLDHPAEARLLAERSVKRVNEMYAVKNVWEELVSIWRH